MGRDDTILIVGAGMAGSLLALVLGRRGLPVAVIDPRREPAPVFRNEKLGHAQIALLEQLGALEPFQRACWPPGAYDPGERPALFDCGAPHETWVRAVRDAWPDAVRLETATVADARLGPERQVVVTADGREIAGRLLVLSTGRMPLLPQALGLERRPLSAGHSVCLGFSVGGPPIPAQVLPATFGTGLGYVSVFPMPGETRVNVFSFRDIADPWTRRMRADPLTALAEAAPAAAAVLEGRRVVRRCEARGTDLYRTHGHHGRPGLVLLGDAAYAPCPASGTGMLRILTDVDALANRLLPTWLATPGMGADKIDAFYADPQKRRCEAASLRSSLDGRARALSASPLWRARRLAAGVRRGGAAQAAASAISGAWAGRMRRSASAMGNQATRSSSG